MHCYATKWRLGVCALAVGAGLMLACQSQETEEGLTPQLDSLSAGSQIQYQALGIEPESVTLAPGQSVTFQAVQWKAGVRSPFPSPFRWSATGGTITSGGVYRAGGTAGRFHVVAQGTTTSYWQEAVVSISATSATVTRINLTPASVTLAPGARQQFAVTAMLSDGTTQNNPTVTWSAAGGTISNGQYTAGSTAGSYRVIASGSNGKRDTSTVTISSGGGSGSGTVLFQEHFDDANLTGRGWYDVAGPVRITTAEHIPGSPASLEVNFNAGATNPSPVAGGRHLFTASNAVYLSYWVKYSSNWVGSGQTYHPHEFSFLTNLDPQYVSPAFNHLTVYVEHNYQNGGYAVLQAQDGQNIDQSRINQNLTDITEQRAVSGCNGNSDGTPTTCYLSGSVHVNGKAWRSSLPVFQPNPGPGYKGDWHHVEVYFRLNTINGGIAQLDGVAQYWFDGTLVIDRRNVLLRTGAHPTMQFAQFLMAPYIGDGSPVAQTMWVDELVVKNARP